MEAVERAMLGGAVRLGVDARVAGGVLERLAAWRYTPGVTRFSSPLYPAAATVFYVVTLPLLTRLMATSKPLHIPRFLFLHNMALCVGSLVLGVWLTVVLGAKWGEGLSPLQMICSKELHENGHLQMIYYINSGFKLWEFADTFLLILRKKPVAFLHWYHHAATLVLTYVQLLEHSTAQWVPIVLNLWVHVFMYYYYAVSALGIRVWWKKHLTTLQICQFVIDIVVISYAYYVFAAGGFSEDACYGTSRAAAIGGGILFSYLLLFVRFFVQTYRRRPSAPLPPAAAAPTGTPARKKDE